jgi:hypothetical protein
MAREAEDEARIEMTAQIAAEEDSYKESQKAKYIESDGAEEHRRNERARLALEWDAEIDYTELLALITTDEERKVVAAVVEDLNSRLAEEQEREERIARLAQFEGIGVASDNLDEGVVVDIILGEVMAIEFDQDRPEITELFSAAQKDLGNLIPNNSNIARHKIIQMKHGFKHVIDALREQLEGVFINPDGAAERLYSIDESSHRRSLSLVSTGDGSFRVVSDSDRDNDHPALKARALDKDTIITIGTGRIVNRALDFKPRLTADSDFVYDDNDEDHDVVETHMPIANVTIDGVSARTFACSGAKITSP